MINRVYDLPALQTQNAGVAPTGRISTTDDPRFREVLRQKLEPEALRFSAHASARLTQRNIELNADDLNKLADAVDQAAKKGGRDILVNMKDVSYVVNAPNRTVVTAVDRSDTRIFTQIDSAVFVS
jgi:flagellar operon protein